jgi:hypothetical protein
MFLALFYDACEICGKTQSLGMSRVAWGNYARSAAIFRETKVNIWEGGLKFD